MSNEEILAGLREIVHEITGVAPERARADASFTEDLEVDSLSMVEIVVAAEERFGVRIPDDEVGGLRTLGDAVDYISRAGVAV